MELETSFSPFFSFFVLFFCLSLFLPSFWCLLCRSCEERQLWCPLVWPTEEFCTPHCLTPLILLLSLFKLFIIITIVIITMTCQHATSTTLPWRSCTRWTQSSYLVVANTYIVVFCRRIYIMIDAFGCSLTLLGVIRTSQSTSRIERPDWKGKDPRKHTSASKSPKAHKR